MNIIPQNILESYLMTGQEKTVSNTIFLKRLIVLFLGYHLVLFLFAQLSIAMGIIYPFALILNAIFFYAAYILFKKRYNTPGVNKKITSGVLIVLFFATVYGFILGSLGIWGILYQIGSISQCALIVIFIYLYTSQLSENKTGSVEIIQYIPKLDQNINMDNTLVNNTNSKHKFFLIFLFLIVTAFYIGTGLVLGGLSVMGFDNSTFGRNAETVFFIVFNGVPLFIYLLIARMIYRAYMKIAKSSSISNGDSYGQNQNSSFRGNNDVNIYSVSSVEKERIESYSKKIPVYILSKAIPSLKAWGLAVLVYSKYLFSF